MNMIILKGKLRRSFSENVFSLTRMHRIEPNRSALHSSTLGASNDVSTIIVGHIFHDLGGSKSRKSCKIAEISTPLVHQDKLIFGVLWLNSHFTHENASY